MGRSEVVRERQCQRVRRRYHRFIVDTNESRELLKMLLKQKRALVESVTRSEPANSALQQYVGAVELVDQLRDEKQSLVELMNEREMLQHQISHIMGDCNSFTNATEIVRRSISTLARLEFRPLSTQDCKDLNNVYYSDIRRAMRAQQFVKTDQSIFGWSDGTKVSDGCINFSLQKDLVGYTPAELSRRSWKLITSPTDYANVYCASFSSSAQTLQVVDENNIVIYERWRRVGLDELCHSLFLVSRFQIEGGYVEICQPLDPSRIQWQDGFDALNSAVGPWVDTDYWTLYCEGEDNTTHVTTGGKITTSSDEDRSYWMVELLLIAMRWENMLVGPRFCLTSS